MTKSDRTQLSLRVSVASMLAFPLHAQDRPVSLQLAWDVPSECPDRDTFVGLVSEQVGAPIVIDESPASLAVALRVTGTARTFAATLRVGAEDATERTFADASCSTLLRTVAIVVATQVATSLDDRAEVAPGEALSATDPATAADTRPRVRLNVASNDPNLTLFLSPETALLGDVPVCSAPCSARIPRGRYYISAQRASGSRHVDGNGRRVVAFDDNARVYLDLLDNSGWRLAGYVAAALAGAMVVGGLIGFGADNGNPVPWGVLIGAGGLTFAASFTMLFQMDRLNATVEPEPASEP